MARKFTNEEIEFVHSMYKTCTYKEIGQVLGRSKATISYLCQIKGWTKNHRLTNKDMQYVISNWNDMTVTELASQIGVKADWLMSYCRSFGLVKYKTKTYKREFRYHSLPRKSGKELRLLKLTAVLNTRGRLVGLNNYRHYTREEVQILLDFRISDAEVALRLNRTLTAIKQARRNLHHI